MEPPTDHSNNCTFFNSVGSITAELSLQMKRQSRILPVVGYSFYTWVGWGNACKEHFPRTQRRPSTTRIRTRNLLISKPSVYHYTTTSHIMEVAMFDPQLFSGASSIVLVISQWNTASSELVCAVDRRKIYWHNVDCGQFQIFEIALSVFYFLLYQLSLYRWFRLPHNICHSSIHHINDLTKLFSYNLSQTWKEWNERISSIVFFCPRCLGDIYNQN